MALGKIKGEYYSDLNLKTDFLKELESKSFIEKTGNFGKLGFWIKVNNLKYKNFSMSNRSVTPRPVPFEFGKAEKNYEGNVFIVQTSGKYFHDMLEVVPQIITLKKAGEIFKVILLSSQPVDPSTGLFYGMTQDEKGYQTISYWRDILKYLRVEYECVTAKPGEIYSSDYNYLFYYSDIGILNKTGFSSSPNGKHRQIIPNLLPELQFDECYIIYTLMYFTTLVHADAYDILSMSLSPLISDVIPGKKIFISRDSAKFPDRSIKNSSMLNEYMAENGFEIFNQENYLWPEQIKKITSAESIVSLVGSGFINAMFCGDKTTMISIHTDKSQDFLTYANQAGRTDVDFKTVYCDPDAVDIINYLKNSKSSITRKVMDDGK